MSKQPEWVQSINAISVLSWCHRCEAELEHIATLDCDLGLIAECQICYDLKLIYWTRCNTVRVLAGRSTRPTAADAARAAIASKLTS